MSRDWPCPACGRGNTHYADMFGQAVPRPGDVSFCAGCHMLLLFDLGALGTIVQRLPSPLEYAELMADERIRDVQALLDNNPRGDVL